MITRRTSFGDWGEQQACGFLERHGFAVKERNYHSVFGEIDIVASRGGDYYFIEVKTRRDSALANDLAITFAKKRKLAKTVRSYCYARQVGGGSIIIAGLIVYVNKMQKKVFFRFCVYC